jgi:hypothetical protein
MVCPGVNVQTKKLTMVVGEHEIEIDVALCD